MAVAGKNFVVQVSTASGGTYVTVAQIQSGTVNVAGENLDVTAFSTGPTQWRSRIRGVKDISWDMSGFYSSTDASGQTAIRSALVNDTDIYMRALLDGTTSNYILQQVQVSQYQVSAAVDGVVELSLAFEGTGTPTVTT